MRVTTPDGAVALVTMSTSGDPNAPCAFCGRTPHAKLCDFPLRGKRVRRCSKRLCDRCATTLGVNLDLCPVHAEVVEGHQLAARLEPLLAQDDVRARDVACDLIESVAGVLSCAVAKPAFKPRDLADWKEFAGERAAIFEYEGGFSREVAERKALALAGERPKK